MNARLWLHALPAVAALGTTAALTAAPAKKAAAPAARDWSRNVVATPEGGYRMGNPSAKVKVVEYGSLTCPTCARFSNSAKTPLAGHVRTGKVSFEFRNYVLNSLDLTAALLARCAGPGGFFRLTETFYATQPQWVAKVSGMTQAQKDQLQALSTDRQIARVAQIGGLTQMAAQVGVTPQKAQACLADKAGLDRLVQMRQAGEAAGVSGTPTFFINGTAVHAHDWAELQPLIQKAGG